MLVPDVETDLRYAIIACLSRAIPLRAFKEIDGRPHLGVRHNLAARDHAYTNRVELPDRRRLWDGHPRLSALGRRWRVSYAVAVRLRNPRKTSDGSRRRRAGLRFLGQCLRSHTSEQHVEGRFVLGMPLEARPLEPLRQVDSAAGILLHLWLGDGVAKERNRLGHGLRLLVAVEL